MMGSVAIATDASVCRSFTLRSACKAPSASPCSARNCATDIGAAEHLDSAALTAASVDATHAASSAPSAPRRAAPAVAVVHLYDPTSTAEALSSLRSTRQVLSSTGP